jgi:glutamine synthetase
LRTGAADAQPHWAIAGPLAAACARIEAELEPGERGEGNLYCAGESLPRTLSDATRSARDDTVIHEILGADAVHDFLALAELEWTQFVGSVSEWDRERYLRSV